MPPSTAASSDATAAAAKPVEQPKPAQSDSIAGDTSTPITTLQNDADLTDSSSSDAVVLMRDRGEAPGLAPLEIVDDAVDQQAKALKKALDRNFGILGVGIDSPQVDQIIRILGPLTAEQRRQVEKRYQELYAPDKPYNPNDPSSSQLRADLAKKLGGESQSFRQVEAILNRETGRTNDAGQAREALAMIATDRIKGEKALRAAFSTLNARDADKLQKDFQERYGKSLDDAMKEAGVSKETIAYINTFKSGEDKRTPEMLVDLAKQTAEAAVRRQIEVSEALRGSRANVVVNNNDYKELLKDILAGTSPAAQEARRRLLADPEFGKQLDKAFPTTAGKPDKEFKDYLFAGAPSLATIVEQNMGKPLGFMLNNPENVTLAVQNVSDAERRAYQTGKQLAGREGDETLTSEQKAALDYYKKTRDAFVRGAGNQPWLADSWDATILYGKDNIISQMASTQTSGLFSYSHTTNDIISRAENLSESDWTRLNAELKANPQGGQFRADIAASLDRYAPEEKARILALLDAKAAAGSYKESQEVRRTLAEVIQDNTTSGLLGGKTVDGKNIIDGILNMGAEDAKRYRNDQEYQNQINDLIAQSLSGRPEKLLAERLLDKTRNTADGEKVKPDAIDKVMIDQVRGAEPADVLRNVEAAFQTKDESGQTLIERLQSGKPLSEADKQIESIIRKAVVESMLLPGQQAERFLQTGKLPPNTKFHLNYPISEVLADAARATPEEQAVLRASLSPEMQKVLDVAIKQKDDPNGPLRLEDRMRAFVLGRDKDSDQFKQELSRLSNEEKIKLKAAYAAKYGSDGKPAVLDNDFVGRVESARQTEFKNLLSTDPGDGRQDFYDNLRKDLQKRGITIDGTELNTERALRMQQDALAEYQRIYQTLPKEKQELLNQYFGEAFAQYQQSKDKFSDLAIDAAITAAALAAAPMTAGMSMATLAAITAAGASFRLAAKQAMMGSDFDWSAANVTKELINGGASAALNFVGAGQIDAIAAGAQRAGVEFGSYLARHGVNEGSVRAARLAAGLGADLTVGGSVGAVSGVAAELLLAPINGRNIDWDSLATTAAMGFAMGAVIPLGIKTLQGGTTVMNVVRGEKGLMWRPENNIGKTLVDGQGNAVVVKPGEAVQLTTQGGYNQVETTVVDGKLADKTTGQLLKTKDGHYLNEQGQPIEAHGPQQPKPKELFDPHHRELDDIPPEVQQKIKEARALYSKNAEANPDAPIVDLRETFERWRAENPELRQRAAREAELRKQHQEALGRGDKEEIDRLTKEHAAATKATNEILQPRAEQLQKQINEALAREGLPPVELDIVGAMDGRAAFSFGPDGKPRIAISREAMLSNESTVQELINHEVDHYLQVTLQGRRIRDIVESQGARLDPNNAEDLARLRAAYGEQMGLGEGPRGGYPSDDFLRSLMKSDKLSAEQTALADRLLEASRTGAPARADNIETANLFRAIDNRAGSLRAQIEANEIAGKFDRDIIDQVLAEDALYLTRREWDKNPNFTKEKIDEIRKVIDSPTASAAEKNAKARELLDILEKRQSDINDWRRAAHEHYAGDQQIDELYADFAGGQGERAARQRGDEDSFGPDVRDRTVFEEGERLGVDGWSRFTATLENKSGDKIIAGDMVLYQGKPTRVVKVDPINKQLILDRPGQKEYTIDQFKELFGNDEPVVGKQVSVPRRGRENREDGWYVDSIVDGKVVIKTGNLRVDPDDVTFVPRGQWPTSERDKERAAQELRARMHELTPGETVVVDNTSGIGTVISNTPEQGVTLYFPALAGQRGESLPDGWQLEFGRYEYIQKGQGRLGDKATTDMIYDSRTGKYYELIRNGTDKPTTRLAREFATFPHPSPDAQPRRRVGNSSHAHGRDQGARDYQEDTFFIEDDIAAVFDGMGGHGGGDIASETARKALQDRAARIRAASSESEARRELDSALLDGHLRIKEKQRQGIDPESGKDMSRMATTAVAAARYQDRLLISSAGDSYAYLFRDGQLTLKSADDSGFDPNSPHRKNLVSNGLGSGDIRMQHNHIDLQPGDRVILASDGLDSLDPQEIRQILKEAPTAEEATRRLMEAVKAKNKYGQDNYTILVMDFPG